MKEVIAVDFDDTIAKHDTRTYDLADAVLLPTVNQLQAVADNYDIIILTARDLDRQMHAKQWLEEHRISQYFKGMTNVKPLDAVFILDDKSMPVDWAIAADLAEKKLLDAEHYAKKLTESKSSISYRR